MSARAERSTTESIEVVPIRGPAPEGEVTSHGQRPRLVRTSLILDDGTRVGVSIAGRGLPLVVVHGYSAEGFLYAQTLSRLVDLGFQVVAIDTAGHGGTQGFPAMGAPFSAYVELLGRAIDALGIRHAVLAGHSMGGRMVAELASLRPERTVGVVLLDAIVGDTWDRMTQGFRVAPLAFLPFAGLLIWDSVSPLHFLRDPAQAVKFARLGTPVLAGHFRHPGRLAGPAMSLVRSGKSTDALDVLREAKVPTVVVQGTLDVVVPMPTARDAVRRTGAQFVTVHHGGHSWLLKDPETLPAIMRELLVGIIGRSRDRLLRRNGVDPSAYTDTELETVCYEPDALALELGPGSTAEDGNDPVHRGDDEIARHASSFAFSIRFD